MFVSLQSDIKTQKTFDNEDGEARIAGSLPAQKQRKT